MYMKKRMCPTKLLHTDVLIPVLSFLFSTETFRFRLHLASSPCHRLSFLEFET